MLKKIRILYIPHIDKIIFALSLLVCAYWYSAQHINVYRFALSGAIYELTALPMLALLIILPLISILLIIKEKLSFQSFSPYALLVLFITFLLLL